MVWERKLRLMNVRGLVKFRKPTSGSLRFELDTRPLILHTASYIPVLLSRMSLEVGFLVFIVKFFCIYFLTTVAASLNPPSVLQSQQLLPPVAST